MFRVPIYLPRAQSIREKLSFASSITSQAFHAQISHHQESVAPKFPVAVDLKSGAGPDVDVPVQVIHAGVGVRLHVILLCVGALRTPVKTKRW